jgi:hypothetical protein
MPTKIDISGYRGTNLFVEFTGLNAGGSAMNLSGYSVSGHARFQPSYTGKLIDLSPTIFGGVLGAAYASGLVQISISAADMAGIPVTEGKYDIEVWDPAGTTATGLFGGKFAVFSEYTY